MKPLIPLLILTAAISALLLLSSCAPHPTRGRLDETDYPYEYIPDETTPATDAPTEPPTEIADTPYTDELCHCGEHYVNEDLRQPTPPLNIREMHEVDAEFLDSFETIHTFTYIQWETDLYSTIVLWPDEILHDFTFLSLGFNGDAERMQFYTREVLMTIGELPPTEAVVLNVAFVHYLIPRGGLIFTDADGAEMRMFISESMRGGCWPIFNLAIHDETHWADWN
jgi:hypothetical protein